MAKNWNDDIIKQYIEAGEDFGFSAVNQDELSGFMAPKPNLEIDVIKAKLDQILELNSTCEGALAVKEQYDALLNLKKNEEKDYIYWPGKQRTIQCDLQVQKLMNLTRKNL